jgi:pantothenate kinase type III
MKNVSFISQGIWRSIAAAVLFCALALPAFAQKWEVGAPIPQAVGKNTADAIRSGLFWGQLGAIRELIHQLTVQSGFETHDLYLTGGAASILSSQLPFLCNNSFPNH